MSSHPSLNLHHHSANKHCHNTHDHPTNPHTARRIFLITATSRPITIRTTLRLILRLELTRAVRLIPTRQRTLMSRAALYTLALILERIPRLLPRSIGIEKRFGRVENLAITSFIDVL